MSDVAHALLRAAPRLVSALAGPQHKGRDESRPGRLKPAPRLGSLIILPLVLFCALAAAQQPAADAIAKADAALAADSANIDLLLAAARARDAALKFDESIALYTKGIALAPEDFRLYRFRGHRYISTRRFEEAVRDLEKARTLAPASFDVSYHLALAYYLRGEFARAADEYGRCLAGEAQGSLAQGFRSCASLDDDSKVAIGDWRYRALRRAGRHQEARRLLESVHEKMQVKENTSYFQALLFYRGLRSEPEVLDPAKAKGVGFPTTGYGVANFHLLEGRKERACGLLREIVKGENWNAFGFIAAEVELARGECPP